MAKKEYVKKTKEESLKEISELADQALAQIEKYTRSVDDVLAYAKFMEQFYHYSVNNQMLIAEQFPGAVAVASFKTWKETGYSVSKGEHGIKILSYTPITVFKDKDGHEKNLAIATAAEKAAIAKGLIKTRKLARFKIGHVFDISQTNADPADLPKIFPNRQFDFEVDPESSRLLQQGIEAIAAKLGIAIRDMRQSVLGVTELGAAKGAFVQSIDCGKKEIVMNPRTSQTQMLSTAIHELAHAYLHNKEEIGKEQKIPTAVKEFQAELTAYIVCMHYGMDTSEEAIPYIASWTKNGQKLEDRHAALDGVQRAAKLFMETIDALFVVEEPAAAGEPEIVVSALSAQKG